MDIYFIRHGETEANVEERLQGHTDTPLTTAGKDHAKNVAANLEPSDPDILISSPLKRSLDTAKLVAQELKVDIKMDSDLMEICYGDWEEASKNELSETEAWNHRVEDKYNFEHPGKYNGVPGQSYADIYERVSEFCADLSKTDETVVVVTHLGVLRNTKKYFEGCSDQEAVAFTPDSDQIYRVSINGEKVGTTLLDPS